MKKNIFSFIFFALTLNIIVSIKVFALIPLDCETDLLGRSKNGWHADTVEYSSWSTGARLDALNVKVENDCVDKIDVGNRSSVYFGFNNEEYFYSGGS